MLNRVNFNLFSINIGINASELSKAIDRLVIPMFMENRLKLSLLSIALFFLLIFPFLIVSLLLTLSIIHPYILNFVILLLAGITLVILFLANLYLQGVRSQSSVYMDELYLKSMIKKLSKKEILIKRTGLCLIELILTCFP